MQRKCQVWYFPRDYSCFTLEIGVLTETVDFCAFGVMTRSRYVSSSAIVFVKCCFFLCVCVCAMHHRFLLLVEICQFGKWKWQPYQARVSFWNLRKKCVIYGSKRVAHAFVFSRLRHMSKADKHRYPNRQECCCPWCANKSNSCAFGACKETNFRDTFDIITLC